MKKPNFIIRFWGVRGSIPTAGSKTVRFGGNTPCIEVRSGNELIILDAGSGIRELGNELCKKSPVQATILFSHLHWDHVQGFPFFTPAYIPGNQFTLVAQERSNLTLEQSIAGQMTYPYFPVDMKAMASAIQFRHFKIGDSFSIGPVQVSTFPTIHPQTGTAFRLECGGKSILYASDTEHPANGMNDPNLEKAASGVSCLIYDATYTDKEYTGNGKGSGSKVGWGHSTWEKGVALAKAAQAKQLILFHHDPTRTDRDLTAIERKVKTCFRNSKAAREGMVLKF